MPVFWWVGLDLVFLVGRAASAGVFWGVCDLIMILVSLSANGCGCVPVLLVVRVRVVIKPIPLSRYPLARTGILLGVQPWRRV